MVIGLLSRPASAETISVSMPITVNSTPMFVAIEEGIASRHGLRLNPVLTTNTSTAPAALLSGSIDVSLLPTPVLVGAVNGGLDLVAIAGGTVTSPTIPEYALLVRSDMQNATAAALGRSTIGVAGLNGPHHIFIAFWLRHHGVDAAGTRFVEIPFTSMPDALRRHSVDAVMATEPALSQVVSSGAGRVAVPVSAEMPGGLPWLLYASTGEWATQHPASLAAFRATLAEAQSFTMAQPDRAKQDLVKYVKLSPAVLQVVAMPEQDSSLTKAGLQWWVDVMSEMKLVAAGLDMSGRIWPR